MARNFPSRIQPFILGFFHFVGSQIANQGCVRPLCVSLFFYCETGDDFSQLMVHTTASLTIGKDLSYVLGERLWDSRSANRWALGSE